MDWARAIDINQSALARIVATLFAMMGLARGQPGGEAFPRPSTTPWSGC